MNPLHYNSPILVNVLPWNGESGCEENGKCEWWGQAWVMPPVTIIWHHPVKMTYGNTNRDNGPIFLTDQSGQKTWTLVEIPVSGYCVWILAITHRVPLLSGCLRRPLGRNNHWCSWPHVHTSHPLMMYRCTGVQTQSLVLLASCHTSDLRLRLLISISTVLKTNHTYIANCPSASRAGINWS